MTYEARAHGGNIVNVRTFISTVAITGLVILGAAGCAAPPAHETTGDATDHRVAVVTAQPVVAVPNTTATSCDAESLPKPAWTPPIVSAVTVQCPGDGASRAPSQVVGAPTGHTGSVIAYSLSGVANQETLQPAESMTAAGIASGSYHPATDIELVVYPDPDAIDTGVSGAGISVSNVQLANGFKALVTQGSNGYGAIRVAWTDGKLSYLLMTTVMKTDSGTSGATAVDMIRMAGSIAVSS